MAQPQSTALQQAMTQGRAEIKRIKELQARYFRSKDKGATGALNAIQAEIEESVYATEIEKDWVTFLLAGGGPSVRLRVQRIGKAPGPATIEVQHWGEPWTRLPIGRLQRSALHWFICQLSPFKAVFLHPYR
jgi:hypothetical protein